MSICAIRLNRVSGRRGSPIPTGSTALALLTKDQQEARAEIAGETHEAEARGGEAG